MIGNGKMIISWVFLMSCLIGCASHRPYHDSQNDLERGENGYLLGFIEFDDQGDYWDRDQALKLLKKLKDSTDGRDVVIVVFTHGWGHNADNNDGNVKTFRHILQKLQEKEDTFQKIGAGAARQVVGIYIGWRGLSLKVEPFETFTFWERKNTAHKVGHGDMTELLLLLEAMHSRLNQKPAGARNRLVIVGHSFGAAVVHSALTQILQDRFVEAAQRDKMLHSFGDLVVLINPAFEAQRYDALQQMAKQGHYKEQLPVMAILSSQGDWPNKVFFPIGRWISTFFEKHSDPEQKQKNRTAVGHYRPFRTHRLIVTQQVDKPESNARVVTLDDTGEESIRGPRPKKILKGAKALSSDSLEDQMKAISYVKDEWKDRTTEAECGWVQPFPGTTLEHLCPAKPPNNPYLVIDVENEIIDGHNGIDSKLLIDFVSNFVIITLPN